MKKRSKIVTLFFFLVLGLGISSIAEEITLTTYYPAPYGAYDAIYSTTLGIGDNDGNSTPGDSGDTPDPSTNPGDVWIAGNVGIGTAAPEEQVHIENTGTPVIKLKNLYHGARSQLLFSGTEGTSTQRGAVIQYYGLGGGMAHWAAVGRGIQFLLGSDGTCFQFGKHSSLTLPGGVGVDPDQFTSWMCLRDGRLGLGVGGLSPPSYQLQLSTDSAGKPNGGGWANSSDSRVKKNIKDIDEPLELILKLHGRQFEWVNPEEHGNLKTPRFGFIAQETETIFPAWFIEVEPRGRDKELVKEGKIKSINIFGFKALTVEAIRQLKAEVSALEVKNTQLEARIKKLEQRKHFR